MSGTPYSTQRLPNRPAVQQRTESFLPPHESEAITSIPVTPGISQGTYGDPNDGIPTPMGIPTPRVIQSQPGRQEYFPRRPANKALAQSSAVPPFGDGILTGSGQGEVFLSGTVLSATFTLPQLLRYRKGGKWELEHKHHCSTHLDSLAYLSSKESPWDHTVIAWTGEIYPVSDDASSSHEQLQESIPTYISRNSKAALEEKLYNDHIRTLPVWLADDCDIKDGGIKLKQQSRWRRYAEHDLCALFHYKQRPPTDGRQADIRWDDYHRTNKAFADRICEVYKPGDIVVVHDHYLMLLPELLRQRHPDMHIVFFLESPFPSSELIRCLHRREQILNGILGSDLICFQAFHFLQHFANSCTRILGYTANKGWVESTRGRVHLTVLPSGINISKITTLGFSPAVDKMHEELRKLHKGKKVIIGCDPMSRFGGVHKKLQAFECFLDRYPSWRHHVVLVQITSPATVEDDDGDNILYARQVNDLASSINQTYGSLDFTPVQIHTQRLSQDEYFAVLRLGDIAVNTCVREGMSTTSLEYVACQRESHGPLIISEFSGTASSLEEAIRINPWDVGQVADEMNNALKMSQKQRNRMHRALYQRVVEGNVQLCVSTMLRRLIKVLKLDESHSNR
ncbi:glycosyltransferase family 20 domain-containing protein [Trichoderma breve]|uniref:Glycosyltransferase family 20 domain-containing protein n=1 Tax=Trichoderma breve TaxID=2034170 RepID=A0A9W9EEM4_9HYPO|nr:glycosyltransferase family 20 domain-containing protein [Trichoderma breve]KAJ4865407.1 glycosyltransferase family 20 domain-containing protein [Trichoderma breve]